MSNNPTIITLPPDAIDDGKVTSKQAIAFHRYEQDLKASDEVTDGEIEAAKQRLIDVRSRVIQHGNLEVQTMMGERAKKLKLLHENGETNVTSYSELKIMWKKKRNDLTLSLLQQVFEVVIKTPELQWLQTAATKVMASTNIHIPKSSSGRYRNFVEEIIHKHCFKNQRKFTNVSRSDKAKIGLMARPNGSHPMDVHCKYDPDIKKFQYQHISGWEQLVKKDPMARSISWACETGTLQDRNPSVAAGVQWVVATKFEPSCWNLESPTNFSESSHSGGTNEVTVETEAAQAPTQESTRAPCPPVEKLTIGNVKTNSDVGSFDTYARRVNAGKHDDVSTLDTARTDTARTNISEVRQKQLCAISLHAS